MSRAWEAEVRREGDALESPYDAIAEFYDPWSRSVTEDVPFYLEEARAAGGPVVELGIGTGRIALPIARAGIGVVGVDTSSRMLALCGQRAEREGLADLIDLRLGDFREPPVEGPVKLVICPFRSYLHLHTDDHRREAFRAAWKLLEPGGRLVFDVFTPAPDDIAQTHGRWLEREPGIFERAHWNTETRIFTLGVRGPGAETVMRLAWTTVDDWRRLLEEAGFEIAACYGWFDRRRYRGGEDTIWIARRPTTAA